MWVRTSPRIARRHPALVSRSRLAVSASASDIRASRAAPAVLLRSGCRPAGRRTHTARRLDRGASAYSRRRDHCDHKPHNGRALGRTPTGREAQARTPADVPRWPALLPAAAGTLAASRIPPALHAGAGTGGRTIPGHRPRGPSCPCRPPTRGAPPAHRILPAAANPPLAVRAAPLVLRRPCPDLRRIAGRSCALRGPGPRVDRWLARAGSQPGPTRRRRRFAGQWLSSRTW